MCDEILKVLGAHLFTSTAVQQERDTHVKCRTRVLILFALVIGLLSTGTLSIAIATDYWIYTHEPYEYKQDFGNNTMLYFHINAGLWRGCFRATEIRKYTTVIMTSPKKVEGALYVRPSVSDEYFTSVVKWPINVYSLSGTTRAENFKNYVCGYDMLY